jgi:type II secretory pathway pseudopilin PulG
MSVRHAHLRVGLWRRAPLRAAFSLLELVIALGVIITLAALFIGISRAVLQSAERRELDAVYTQLYAALDAWQQANGRELTFQRRLNPTNAGGLNDALDRNPDPQFCFEGMPSADLFEENFDGRYIIVLLMDRMAQVEESRELLSRIKPDYLRPVLRNPINSQPLDPLPGNWTGVASNANPNGMPAANAAASVLKEVVDPWGNRLGVVFPGRPLCRGELQRCATGDPAYDCADGSVRTRDEHFLGSCRNRRPYFISSGPDGRFGNGDDILSYEPLRR